MVAPVQFRRHHPARQMLRMGGSVSAMAALVTILSGASDEAAKQALRLADHEVTKAVADLCRYTRKSTARA